MGYARILVGTDGSATADKAVETAAELARQLGADLHVVTAYRQSGGPGMGSASGAAMADPGRSAEGLHAERRPSRSPRRPSPPGERDSRTRAHAASGSAADAILDTAESCGADLIVVGSKGMRRRPPGARLGAELGGPRGQLRGPDRQDGLKPGWPAAPAGRRRPGSLRRCLAGPGPRGVQIPRHARRRSPAARGASPTRLRRSAASTWCSSMRRWTKPSREAARYRRHTRARPSPTSATASSQWASRLAPHAAHVRA